MGINLEFKNGIDERNLNYIPFDLTKNEDGTFNLQGKWEFDVAYHWTPVPSEDDGYKFFIDGIAVCKQKKGCLISDGIVVGKGRSYKKVVYAECLYNHANDIKDDSNLIFKAGFGNTFEFQNLDVKFPSGRIVFALNKFYKKINDKKFEQWANHDFEKKDCPFPDYYLL
jgi:hypothetical protein